MIIDQIPNIYFLLTYNFCKGLPLYYLSQSLKVCYRTNIVLYWNNLYIHLKTAFFHLSKLLLKKVAPYPLEILYFVFPSEISKWNKFPSIIWYKTVSSSHLTQCSFMEKRCPQPSNYFTYLKSLDSCLSHGIQIFKVADKIIGRRVSLKVKCWNTQTIHMDIECL